MYPGAPLRSVSPWIIDKSLERILAEVHEGGISFSTFGPGQPSGCWIERELHLVEANRRQASGPPK